MRNEIRTFLHVLGISLHDPATVRGICSEGRHRSHANRVYGDESLRVGSGPEYIERFSKYNTIIGAPLNALKYGSVPAAWNNMYYPAPGDPPPSILPCTQACAPALAKSYIPPAVEMVPQPL